MYLTKSLSIDFLYAMAFITFLSHGKNELNHRKADMAKKCQRQKEDDAAALADEGNESINLTYLNRKGLCRQNRGGVPVLRICEHHQTHQQRIIHQS